MFVSEKKLDATRASCEQEQRRFRPADDVMSAVLEEVPTWCPVSTVDAPDLGVTAMDFWNCCASLKGRCNVGWTTGALR